MPVNNSYAIKFDPKGPICVGHDGQPSHNCVISHMRNPFTVFLMWILPIALFILSFILFMGYIRWKNRAKDIMKEGERSLLEDLILKDNKRVQDEEA